MMTEKPKTGFIGAGNMAAALIKGLIHSRSFHQDRLCACDKEKKTLTSISTQFGIECHSSNIELVRECSIVVLSVKPQNVRDVLEEVKGEIRDDHLIISIAAGIPLAMIRGIIGKAIPLIRVMPNTPALVQKGVSALAGGDPAGPEHMAMARAIFDAVGDTVEVEESMMDAVTALSGSGPGYVFRMMECMVNAGTSVGLEQDISIRLVVQTFLGAAHLAKESEHSLAQLREMVTSPGGTTAEGLATFDRMGLEDMTIKAVEAACKRSVELGKDD
ncbi:MAG: pyrroline-5-carboxylate reductase [Deltaproteobacteria bacterium]|nr:pyrroline-5-carboxylate reductase [Deltaproteobacteria bacterium]